MKIIDLSPEQTLHLYNTRMENDFPPSELRPYSSIASLTAAGAYRFLGYGDPESPAAYAAFAVKDGAALLDYYAVDPTLRGQGVGGRFLQALRLMDMGVPYVLIEVESVESANTPEELEERRRRIRFYLHNGCKETAVYSHLFGVEYRILILPLSPCSPSDDAVMSSLIGLYRIIVPSVPAEGLTFSQVCRVEKRK